MWIPKESEMAIPAEKRCITDANIQNGAVILPYLVERDFYIDNLFADLKKKQWIVYCKEPFENPNNLIEYLGRYTHRIAISNYRIKEVTEHTVSFQYKDYRDNQEKVLTLQHEEFIKRFLQHIVPSGFMRIRYYGILSNPCRKKLLPICRRLLKDRMPRLQTIPSTFEEYYLQIAGQHPKCCHHCKEGIPIGHV